MKALMASVLVLASSIAVAQRQDADPFALGRSAYEQGEFERAIAAWEELVRQGTQDPAVYYNLGNAYFKLDRLGPAVLNWERARRLDPRDSDVRENLGFARRLLVDEVPEVHGTVGLWLDRAADLVSFEEVALGALVLWTLLGVAGVVAILGTNAKRRAALAGGAVLLVLLLLHLPLLGWHLSRLGGQAQAVVLASSVEVRSGPGERYTSVFSVHEGLVLRVRQSASGWYRVSLPNGLGGWLPADTVGRL